jgi:hypothetical protein
MATGSPAEKAVQGFAPLAPLLRVVDPFKRDEARQRLRKLERTDLLARYREAFSSGRRVHAYLMAQALVGNGVPPFVWHESLHLDELNVSQRFDLFMGDLLWLRHEYPDHAKHVRYRRCRAVLTGHTAIFHQEAEFMWYAGRRPVWKLVGSLSLTERQQWDCALLRSTPVRKQAAATEVMGSRVLTALQDDVRTVRQTATFGETEALATAQRRYLLWRCSRMVGADSAQQVATRYEQLTGVPITRQAAAQQLEKVRSALAKIKMRF